MKNQTPVLFWLSYFTRGPHPKHAGTCIVEANRMEHALARADSLGIAPADCDVQTQGLSEDSVPFYRAHLNTLMDDTQLVEAFGEEGVLLLDRKTTLGEHLEALKRKTYEPPAIVSSQPYES